MEETTVVSELPCCKLGLSLEPPRLQEMHKKATSNLGTDSGFVLRHRKATESLIELASRKDIHRHVYLRTVCCVQICQAIIMPTCIE
jgi:hypothetical protein